jgi:hypothetical protein
MENNMKILTILSLALALLIPSSAFAKNSNVIIHFGFSYSSPQYYDSNRNYGHGYGRGYGRSSGNVIIIPQHPHSLYHVPRYQHPRYRGPSNHHHFGPRR